MLMKLPQQIQPVSRKFNRFSKLQAGGIRPSFLPILASLLF
jgi:hypothetical protein